jgi:hypothetical protein
MKDDKSRLENFLDALSEDMVKKLTGQLFQRCFKHELSVELENFKENFIKDSFSNFSDPEIREAQEKFYQSLKELDWFILMNFKRRNSSGDYRLKPDVQKGVKKWGELNLLAKDFEEKYKNFVLVASKKIKPNDDLRFEIEFRNRRIILKTNNGEEYVIKQLQFERSNENYFDYIFSHPNKKINNKEISEKTKTKNNQTFNKFVDSVGFKGEIRKCFFNINKSVILFTNPITENELNNRNIRTEKLLKQIKRLKKNK